MFKSGAIKTLSLSNISSIFWVALSNRPNDFLKACECDSRGRAGLENCELTEANLLLKLLKAATSIDAGSIAKAQGEPEKIKQAVFQARLQAVKQAL